VCGRTVDRQNGGERPERDDLDAFYARNSIARKATETFGENVIDDRNTDFK
jgi:hypothetical protein